MTRLPCHDLICGCPLRGPYNTIPIINDKRYYVILISFLILALVYIVFYRAKKINEYIILTAKPRAGPSQTCVTSSLDHRGVTNTTTVSVYLFIYYIAIY